MAVAVCAGLVLPAPTAEAGRNRLAGTMVSFRTGGCPSFHAPDACPLASGSSCHEAFVDGGPAATCVAAQDRLSELLLPEDGPGDGGSSRAWSFAVRPQGRDFDPLLHPEVTGSVRVASDGLGAAGSRSGASDAAHLRLTANRLALRLLVLRWWTAGLPPGAEARLRLEGPFAVLFETSEPPGPAVARLQVIPLLWSGDLDLSVSAVVSAPRDLAVPSADLLWHLAVLLPGRDDDHDGVANDQDPHPLDRNVPSAPAPSGRPRVLVVGLDGAGWDVLDVLMQGGYLPTIRSLVESGVRAPLYEPDANPAFCCYCPPVWSSLATGVAQNVHHMSQQTSEPWDRGAPAVWTELVRRGGSVTHVSYRNTFPAEPGTTYSLSEPGLDVAGSLLHAAWPAPGERGEGMNRLQQTWPPLLLEALGVLPAVGSGLPAWGIFARDRAAMQALAALAQTDPTDLTLATLHAPDKSSHVAWASVQTDPSQPLDAAALLAQAAAWSGPVFDPAPVGWGNVASQYLEADAALAELLSAASYDYVLFVSDHAMTVGFVFAGGHTTPPAFHGIFALSGPGVVPGASLGSVSVLDVAPTLAYLLELPVAQDLPGRVITEAFTAQHLATHSIASVPSW